MQVTWWSLRRGQNRCLSTKKIIIRNLKPLLFTSNIWYIALVFLSKRSMHTEREGVVRLILTIAWRFRQYRETISVSKFGQSVQFAYLQKRPSFAEYHVNCRLIRRVVHTFVTEGTVSRQWGFGKHRSLWRWTSRHHNWWILKEFWLWSDLSCCRQEYRNNVASESGSSYFRHDFSVNDGSQYEWVRFSLTAELLKHISKIYFHIDAVQFTKGIVMNDTGFASFACAGKPFIYAHGRS